MNTKISVEVKPEMAQVLADLRKQGVNISAFIRAAVQAALDTKGKP